MSNEGSVKSITSGTVDVVTDLEILGLYVCAGLDYARMFGDVADDSEKAQRAKRRLAHFERIYAERGYRPISILAFVEAELSGEAVGGIGEKRKEGEPPLFYSGDLR